MPGTSPDDNEPHVARGFINGVKAGLPIAISYLPPAVACGILSNAAGLTTAEGVFMSLIVFAGASQFVAMKLLALGVSFPEIILATGVLNARLVMYSSSFSRRLLPGAGTISKAWTGFQLTDESFSVMAARPERYLAPEFCMGLNLPGHLLWVAGTFLGYMGASFMPAGLQKSMGVAIYALFIGLLAPIVKKNRRGLVVATAAMSLSAFFKWAPLLSGMNVGVMIMSATGLASLLGAYLLQRGSSAR